VKRRKLPKNPMNCTIAKAYHRIVCFLVLTTFIVIADTAPAQPTKDKLQERLLATYSFMQQKMWNPNNGNFIRRTDVPSGAQKTDAWGVTIVLDAYAYMYELGLMKADAIKQYFHSSTALYERTDNGHGARIIARQGSQIYVGGDDELQWIAALMHLYSVTKDPEYLNEAQGSFTALVTTLGFWSTKPTGWSWNSNDRRPMGVSTSYGALAAARLFEATKDSVYKKWTDVALRALQMPQVSYIPRDRMIAAEAAATLYKLTKEKGYLDYALATTKIAVEEVDQVLKGKKEGERNPTDVGDLAEGLYSVADITGDKKYAQKANALIEFFHQKRTVDEIKSSGHYSRYTTEGKPDVNGQYLGVPLTAQYLPEVAEMLKIEALQIVMVERTPSIH